MKELRDILNAYEQAARDGKSCALATVVHVDGSAYRRAGARMLITEDGKLTGAISGGCLEGDALRKARLAMSEQKKMLIAYDTTDDDDAKLGVGLGCNGIIHILIEPLALSGQPDPVNFFRSFVKKRERAVIITVFNMEDRHAEQLGTCLLLEANGKVEGTLWDDQLASILISDAMEVLRNGQRAAKVYKNIDRILYFIELLEPEISLVIAGAGNDAYPFAQIAKVLGWTVTIADGRPNYTTPDRFPFADRILTTRPEDLLSQVGVDSRTVFMLMTHNYNYDSALLEKLMPLDIPYIGVLGPKKRLVRMLGEMFPAMTDVVIPDNVFGPAGLDIGSENAEEIAISVIAEIRSVFSRSEPASLKTKSFIHDRASEIVELHHQIL